MQIAVSIPVKDLNSALELIEEANLAADLIELRLDYAKSLSERDLKRLIDSCKKPVIATNRLKKEGGNGNFSGTETDRVNLLIKAIEFKAGYVDIEFGAKPESVKKILKNRNGSKIILSYHDFKKTPKFLELKKLLKKMIALKPDVVKIACTALKKEDNESIILLIEEAKKSNVEIIAFCMGHLGKYSRAHSCDFGACITFASIGMGLETAAGQMTISELNAYRDEFG